MPSSETLTLAGDQATRLLGEALGRALSAGAIVALCGDLGAGKTTLTQGLAIGMGLPASARVTSPSYNLVCTYPTHPPLHHLDLYRLTHSDELFELGFDDLINGNGVVVVEWADRFPASFPAETLWIRLEWVDEAHRLATLGPAPLPAPILALIESLRREAQ